MATLRSFSHLVVIGSSAGGIEALSAVVATLPQGFPAPIVIGQHLDPSRPSHLGDILSRRSTLPVRTLASAETQPLESGIVYVVPSNRDVFISDSTIELRADRTDGGSYPAGRPKPSIDLLLSSAAETFGDRLVAVILTGTGSDGAAGARAVKKAGGTVVIQNPETASYPGMPLSLAPTTVDIVANLDRVGPVLHDLLMGIEVPTQPAEKRQLESFLQEIRARFDIDFTTYKTPTILRRLQRRVIATDSGDLGGYIQYLRAHPEEYQQLVNAFLIKVTDFFRDPDLYAFLRATLLPELIDYARQHDNELRIWSAGCATGEEAYSLAIVVAEVLGNEIDQLNIRIFATDVDGEAVAFARRGVYPAAALSGMPEELISRYFTREDGNYVVRKRVRALTVFGQHDLGQRAPFPHIDLVMCRNVLIYFTAELQQRTLKLFAYSLRDGGYLVLGKAESTGPLAEYFTLQHKNQRVYQRQGDRILMPPARLKEVIPSPQRLGLGMRRRGGSSLVSTVTSEKDPQRLRTLSEGVLLRLPVGVVVVDRHYDIQAINQAARGFLGIHSPAVGEDLVHLARDVPSTPLRGAIDETFRTGVPVALEELAVEEMSTGAPRFLQISCHPRRPEGDHGPIDSVLLVVNDVTSLVRGRQQVELRLDDTSAALEHARQESQETAAQREQLMQRLTGANRQLLDANQELTSANEELRTTNEEFLLSAEEAQAATEEVETLNEELQATNEELETLNEELQATVEELNTTNDDLHARSVELQDLAQASERERARLEVILSGMGDAVLVVNAQGTPILTNAAYARMFGPAGARLVPRDEDGNLLPRTDTPQARAARGDSFSMEFTVNGEDGEVRWFEANGQPIRTVEGDERGGGVVVVRDTTLRSLHRLQQEFIARASHELRTPLTPLRLALDRLLRNLPDRPDTTGTRRDAETARAMTSRFGRLVDDLLDVARLQSGKFSIERQPIQLEKLVTHAVETARLMAGDIPIKLDIAGAPIEVEGDEHRLEQVILNLLGNAVAYAPKSRQIEVRLRRANGEAEIQIQDYGPGIPVGDLPHVFERFYQTAHESDHLSKGLGLGLYMAREIVTAHGGRIDASSTVGQGTSFTIHLPPRADAGTPPAPEPRGGRGRGR